MNSIKIIINLSLAAIVVAILLTPAALLAQDGDCDGDDAVCQVEVTVSCAEMAQPTPGCVNEAQGEGVLRIFEMQDLLADHEDQLTYYQRQLETQRAALSTERRRNDAQDAQLEAINRELARLAGLSDEIDAAQQMIASNTVTLETLESTVDGVGQRVTALGQRIDDLEEEVDALRVEIAVERDRNDAQDDAIARVVRPTFGLGAFAASGVDTAGYFQVGWDNTLGPNMRMLALFHVGTDNQHPAIGASGIFQYEYRRWAVGAGIVYHRDLGDNETNVESQGIVVGPTVEAFLNEGRNYSFSLMVGYATNSEQISEEVDEETTGLGGTFGFRVRFP